MGSSSFAPVRFAVVLSLSLAAFHSSSSSRVHSSKPSIPSPVLKFKPPPSPSPAKPKASASDLLSILGTRQQAANVNPEVADELRSCLKFLVPFTPTRLGTDHGDRAPGRRWLRWKSGRAKEEELVWSPPRPVLEMARLALDSGGDPGAIHRILDPTVIPVPDVEGSKESLCELTRTPYGRRFVNEELNSYLEILFELLAARGPAIGLDVSLNRFDLFHGHLFLPTDSKRLGILFHAKEYPAYDSKAFPYNTGYCQKGSTVAYDDSMNLRNILWLAPLPSNSSKAWLAPGVLVVLDAHKGGIIYRDLIPDYAREARTLYEEDFGDVVVDVNYLNVGVQTPDYQIFIC